MPPGSPDLLHDHLGSGDIPAAATNILIIIGTSTAIMAVPPLISVTAIHIASTKQLLAHAAIIIAISMLTNMAATTPQALPLREQNKWLKSHSTQTNGLMRVAQTCGKETLARQTSSPQQNQQQDKTRHGRAATKRMLMLKNVLEESIALRMATSCTWTCLTCPKLA